MTSNYAQKIVDSVVQSEKNVKIIEASEPWDFGTMYIDARIVPLVEKKDVLTVMSAYEDVAYISNLPDKEEQMAYGHLIGAAPDLLRACNCALQMILDVCHDGDDTDDGVLPLASKHPCVLETQEQLKNAIKKALGWKP